MSKIRISSTMALMSPISQPLVAKLVGISDGTGKHTDPVTLPHLPPEQFSAVWEGTVEAYLVRWSG